jgi:threonine dehydrogenase-like Zn-dependent dehydrogenase
MKALFVENRLERFAAGKAAKMFAGAMGAATGPMSPVRYASVPEPSLPGPRWIKVRNKACGLCGTDVHLMALDLDPKSFPAALPGLPRVYLGHEVLSVVEEVGAAVEGIRPGDRVAVRIDWPSCAQMELSPPCPRCAEGAYMLCENPGRVSLPRDTGGGFSTRSVLHQAQPFVIPDALSDDQALLLEPAAVAVHAALRALPGPGDSVLVIGAGTIGLLLVAALRHLAPDAEVRCLARHRFQAEAAADLGARVISGGGDLYRRMASDTGARYVKGHLGNEILLGGFDVIFDTVGNDQTLQDALRWCRGGGRLALVGVNMEPGKVDYSPLWHQEITVIGVNSHATEADGRTSFDHAAVLLAACPELPGLLLTHRFPVARWKDAVRAFLDKKGSRAIKIVLEH